MEVCTALAIELRTELRIEILWRIPSRIPSEVRKAAAGVVRFFSCGVFDQTLETKHFSRTISAKSSTKLTESLSCSSSEPSERR